MSTIKLQAGAYNSGAWATLSYSAGAFNSLADGSFVLLTTTIDNSSALDLWCELEGEAVVGGTTVARSFLAAYLLPERSDAASYGDDTGSGTNPPNGAYWAATLGVKTGITSGATAKFITPRPFLLTRGVHKIGIQSKLTVALSGTPAAVFKIRTTGLQSA